MENNIKMLEYEEESSYEMKDDLKADVQAMETPIGTEEMSETHNKKNGQEAEGNSFSSSTEVRTRDFELDRKKQ